MMNSPDPTVREIFVLAERAFQFRVRELVAAKEERAARTGAPPPAARKALRDARTTAGREKLDGLVRRLTDLAIARGNHTSATTPSVKTVPPRRHYYENGDVPEATLEVATVVLIAVAAQAVAAEKAKKEAELLYVDPLSYEPLPELDTALWTLAGNTSVPKSSPQENAFPTTLGASAGLGHRQVASDQARVASHGYLHCDDRSGLSSSVEGNNPDDSLSRFDAALLESVIQTSGACEEDTTITTLEQPSITHSPRFEHFGDGFPSWFGGAMLRDTDSTEPLSVATHAPTSMEHMVSSVEVESGRAPSPVSIMANHDTVSCQSVSRLSYTKHDHYVAPCTTDADPSTTLWPQLPEHRYRTPHPAISTNATPFDPYEFDRARSLSQSCASQQQSRSGDLYGYTTDFASCVSEPSTRTSSPPLAPNRLQRHPSSCHNIVPCYMASTQLV